MADSISSKKPHHAHASATLAATATDGAGSSDKTGHQKGANTFTTATLNIKSNPKMSKDKVLHDVHRIASQTGLIGWQEVSPGYYHDAIKSLGKDWKTYQPHFGKGWNENAISWNTKVWEKAPGKDSEGVKKISDGMKHVTPDRFVTWVKLKNKQTGQTIVRMNTHLVSGAFTPGKSHHDYRLKCYNQEVKAIKDLKAKFEKQGTPVIIGGDMNHDSAKILGNTVDYDNNINVGTHGKNTYDYLMSSKGPDLKPEGAHVDHDYNSDHDAVIAKFRFNVPQKA